MTAKLLKKDTTQSFQDRLCQACISKDIGNIRELLRECRTQGISLVENSKNSKNTNRMEKAPYSIGHNFLLLLACVLEKDSPKTFNAILEAINKKGLAELSNQKDLPADFRETIQKIRNKKITKEIHPHELELAL